MDFFRNVYHRLLLVPGVPCFFRLARRNCATIFMMHRFTHEDRGIVGFEPAQLRKGLEFLRRNNFEFLSLTELFSRLNGNDPQLRGEVVFTIDDGYIDHAEIAAPIFAEYDCPVTVFATTGFLDGKLWMWWNKIEYIFINTKLTKVELSLGNETVCYDLIDVGSVNFAQDDFIERCKILEDEKKLLAIVSLAESAEVELPERAPGVFAPMTWDDARNCEKNDMTFGPHTVTHPVLSRTTSERSEWEITESWSRLCAEVEKPVPIFCYPNGQMGDFGQREILVFRKLGFSGAVVGVPGFAEPKSGKDIDWSFKVPRFSYPASYSDLIQYVSGVERCKHFVRRCI